MRWKEIDMRTKPDGTISIGGVDLTPRSVQVRTVGVRTQIILEVEGDDVTTGLLNAGFSNSGADDMLVATTMPFILSDVAQETRWLPPEEATSQDFVQRFSDAMVSPAAFRAKQRGMRVAVADLKAAGGGLSSAQARELLGDISRERLSQLAQAGALLALPAPGSNGYVYPADLIRDGAPLPGLKTVLNALPLQNPWVRLNWLVTGDARLGDRTPLQVLKDGDVGAVVDAARGYGDQTAA
jgi:hypothetical protein